MYSSLELWHERNVESMLHSLVSSRAGFSVRLFKFALIFNSEIKMEVYM